MSDSQHGITQGEFHRLFEDGSSFLLLDVRRRQAYESDSAVIAGAQWRDPEQVTEWHAEIPRDKPVVAYCVHGHGVSQGVAQQLQAGGCDARYLEGGIDAWRQPAGPTEPKPG